MTGEDVFEVRVNRALLAILAGVGALFFVVGLDAIYFHSFFTWNTEGKEGLFLVFKIVCLFIGGIIALQCGWYVLFPPLMMRLNKEGLSFGTGFRYTQLVIPGSAVKDARLMVGVPNLSFWEMLCVQVTLESRPDIPNSLATGAGIGYMCYILNFSLFYINCFPWTMVNQIRRYQREVWKK